ncbi:hypothetical protein CPB85DRAFT_1451641 [Mucidula mucida]|nr:hypothetical protein CPB85DRAFT_1451641 [Mucidula mucida]
MSNDDQQREMLEVEDEEARHRRLEAYMRKLDSSRPVVATSTTAFEFGDRKTFPIDPPADLLARVQSFLPQMEASNAILSQRAEADPKSVDIEHLADNMEQYIEMNLGLGVFEQHGKDFEMGSSSSSSSDSEDDEDSDSDTDSDSSSEIITSHSTCPRIIKPLPRRTPSGKAPQIVVLGSQDWRPPSPKWSFASCKSRR